MKSLSLIACVILTLCIISSSSNADEKRVGSFSGQWRTSFTKDGIPASGGGSIRITVHPDDTFFTCKISGSVSGSGKSHGGKMSVKSSMTSSGCKGSYSPENGYIDGSFTAREKGSASLALPNKKPMSKTRSTSWAGSIRGKIADTAGEGFWADDEGHDSGWTVSGSFTGGEEVTEEAEKEEEDEWDSFETERDKMDTAMEVSTTMIQSWRVYRTDGGTKDFADYLEQEVKDPDTFIKIADMIMLANNHLKEQAKKEEKVQKKIVDYKKSAEELKKSYQLYRKTGGKAEPEEYIDSYIEKNIEDPKKKKAVRTILKSELNEERAWQDPYISALLVASLSEETKPSEERIMEAIGKVGAQAVDKAIKTYEAIYGEKWKWSEDDKAKESKNYKQVKKIKKRGKKAAEKNFRKGKVDRGKQVAGWTNMGKALEDTTGGNSDTSGNKAFEKGIKYQSSKTLVKKVDSCIDGKSKRACKSLDQY